MLRNVALVLWFLFIVNLFICNPLLATTIDDFSQGAVTLVDTLDPSNVSNLKTGLQIAHTFATARHVAFNAIDPYPFGDSGRVTVQVDTNNGGSLKLFTDPGLTAANSFVSYGVMSLGLPPMSLNLNNGGADSILFDFAYTIPDARIASARFNLDVLLKSGNGASFYVYQPVPSSPEPFSVQLPYSQILASQPTFDLRDVTEIRIGTSNGTMDGAFALSEIRTNSRPAVPAGDFDHNGAIDAADYAVWRKGLSSTYSQSDYETWRAHFGQTAGSGSSTAANHAVPEPAAALLIIATAGSYLWRRR